MADNLEWSKWNWNEKTGGGWYLVDKRGEVECMADVRAAIFAPLDSEVAFYPTYESSECIRLPKPEGVSIDQLKDWALSQFLLIRES